MPTKAQRLTTKLRKLGLEVRPTNGGHLVVKDPDTRQVLGVYGQRGAHGNYGRAHKNLRAKIKRVTGIDIDA